jgi:peptidoglycan/LPS O-acetylase OafA/YrhL
MDQSTHRQHALDGMRGIAALVVFAIHLWIYQLPDSLALRRGSWETFVLFEGRVAFVMFFVLSGYLLYRGFARAALGRSEAVSNAGYLLRRAARILPAYYAALAGTLVLLTLAGDGAPGRRMVDGSDLPLFLIFGQNYSNDTVLMFNAATWTLTVEVAFYLVLPLVGLLALRLGSARRQVLLLGSLVLVGMGWNLVHYLADWGTVGGHAPLAYLQYFACGMLIALAVEWSRARDFALSHRQSAGLLVGAAVLLLANGLWHARLGDVNGLSMELFADLAAAVAFAAIIASFVLGTGAGLRWLAWRPIAWIGTITYGLYLWHIPVIVFTGGIGLLPGGALLAVVALPISIALGAASWYLLEQPFMKRAARAPRTRPPASSEAKSARSRSRIPARTAPPPASWSGRAAAERR